MLEIMLLRKDTKNPLAFDRAEDFDPNQNIVQSAENVLTYHESINKQLEKKGLAYFGELILRVKTQDLSLEVEGTRDQLIGKL